MTLFVCASEISLRVLFIPVFLPVVRGIEWPLWRIEKLIWPGQMSAYTTSGIRIVNGAPDWLAAAMIAIWLLLAPFAIGACAGMVCRRAFSRRGGRSSQHL